MTQAISNEQIYEELKRIESKMATREEVESLLDTIKIMSNPEMMRQIADSLADIKDGKVKEIHSVKDMLAEM